VIDSLSLKMAHLKYLSSDERKMRYTDFKLLIEQSNWYWKETPRRTVASSGKRSWRLHCFKRFSLCMARLP